MRIKAFFFFFTPLRKFLSIFWRSAGSGAYFLAHWMLFMWLEACGVWNLLKCQPDLNSINSKGWMVKRASGYKKSSLCVCVWYKTCSFSTGDQLFDNGISLMIWKRLKHGRDGWVHTMMSAFDLKTLADVAGFSFTRYTRPALVEQNTKETSAVWGQRAAQNSFLI